MKKAELISEMNSAIGCQYIGISQRRAYLEYWDGLAQVTTAEPSSSGLN